MLHKLVRDIKHNTATCFFCKRTYHMNKMNMSSDLNCHVSQMDLLLMFPPGTVIPTQSGMATPHFVTVKEWLFDEAEEVGYFLDSNGALRNIVYYSADYIPHPE